MKIECIKTGYLEENCYVISKGNEALIVDPGDDYERIINLVGNKNVLAVLITHYHFDHTGALEEIKNHYNSQVIDYKNKKENIGPFNFEVIDTKGHKEDSVSFYFKKEKVMFVGDFIFEGTIGRCDLAGGNFKEMLRSLNMIKKYDKDTTLYPGHGHITTLGKELLNNPYMKGEYYE